MAIVEPIVLGITQGITEFLPISSDGHLILVPALLGWKRFGLGFDVALHLGTLVATVAYFRADVARLLTAAFTRDPARTRDRRLAFVIAGATVPSVVIALALEPLVDGVEELPLATQTLIVGGFLLVTAAALALAEVLGKRWREKQCDAHDLPWWKALAVGTAQGFAVAPGLSRSGTTIATGVALGMGREEAARFSFLLSIPIVGAATAKKLLLDVLLEGKALPPTGVVAIGVLTTAVVGYAAIAVLLPYVRRHALYAFAVYAALVGSGILVWDLLA